MGWIVESVEATDKNMMEEGTVDVTEPAGESVFAAIYHSK